MKNHSQRPSTRGFALIEVLVSLVVVAFGMLALAGMQLNLSRNADVAKQRSEAVRLAQEKMECLRAFSQLAASATTSATRNCMGALRAVNTWTDMATVASDPVNPITSAYSNTSYARSWTIGGAAADTQRAITVTLAWTDRAGEAQTYTLSSVVSRSNPDNTGTLSFPLPQGINLKRPKNRSLNIPIPAVSVAVGTSAYQINATLAVVFNDNSGYVVQRCSTTVTAANYATLVANGQCTTFNAYIIAGYISGDSTWAGLATSLPTGINTDSINNASAGTISCSYSPTTQVTDQNTGAAVSGTYRYYLCVIPVASGGTWSGTMRLSGMTTSNSGSRWRVCRYEYPASTLFPNDNERNVQPYVNVASSLDSQNYYVTAGTCAAGTYSVFNGPSSQTVSYNRVQHQDCRTGQATTTTCPTTFTGP